MLKYDALGKDLPHSGGHTETNVYKLFSMLCLTKCINRSSGLPIPMRGKKEKKGGEEKKVYQKFNTLTGIQNLNPAQIIIIK